nr:MAG TPA: hypothetical protein [Caudoviricetes sp.]
MKKWIKNKQPLNLRLELQSSIRYKSCSVTNLHSFVAKITTIFNKTSKHG